MRLNELMKGTKEEVKRRLVEYEDTPENLQARADAGELRCAVCDRPPKTRPTFSPATPEVQVRMQAGGTLVPICGRCGCVYVKWLQEKGILPEGVEA